jgi:hypothetical protein
MADRTIAIRVAFPDGSVYRATAKEWAINLTNGIKPIHCQEVEPTGHDFCGQNHWASDGTRSLGLHADLIEGKLTRG